MRRLCILALATFMLLGAVGCKKKYVGEPVSPGYATQLNYKTSTTHYSKTLEHYKIDLTIENLGLGHYNVTGTAEALQKDRFKRHGAQEFRLLFIKHGVVVDNIRLGAHRFNDEVQLFGDFETDISAKEFLVTYKTTYYQ